jgi:hypothetical protein
MSKNFEIHNANLRKKQITFVDLQKIRPKTIFFLSSAIIFLSYIRPIFSIWAYSDEYDFFEVIPKIGKHMAQDGNLISSLLYDNFSTQLINSTEDLWRLRILSFLCLFLILNHVSSLILNDNQSRSIQFLLPIAMTLPAPMTFISWSLIWQGSLAMLIAYTSHIFWLKSHFKFKAIAVVFLWTSILMSPVPAFSVFGFQAVIFILSRDTSLNYLKKTTKLLLLYGISGIAALGTILISTNLNQLNLNERVGPPEVRDIPEKIYWLVSRPLVVSMRFFDISSPSQVNALITTLLVFSILICGFRVQSKELGENVLTRAFLFFLLLFLSITPIAVTWSNQIEFRYIFGPSVAFFIVVIALVLDLIKRNEKIRKFVFLPFILLTLIIGISSMNNNVSDQFIDPFKSKNAFIYSQIVECQNEKPNFKKILIQQASTEFPTRSNIGMLSQTTDLASPWVPIPSVIYVLKENDLFPRETSLLESVGEDNLETCIIDLEQYRKLLAIVSKIPKS